MNILVLAANYPRPDGHISLMYIHARNKAYLQAGISVTVLNFAARESYMLDGISVLSPDAFNPKEKQYDALLLHAPNVRCHYRFLKQYQQYFPRLIFFFHGHEVLRLKETYPAPFPFEAAMPWYRKCIQNSYDTLKLSVWRNYLPKVAAKSDFVFVSRWMEDYFFHYTRIPRETLAGRCHRISNAVAPFCEKESYDFTGEKEYDFITVRGSLDGSKYAIDIVNDLAKSNPSLRFLLVGKGTFFSHVEKAENLTWINGTLSHTEMPAWFNKARCGLMPTRLDSQGLMTCEMATFGLPTITSDIGVCHEVLENFENVALISNENTALDLSVLLEKLCSGHPYAKAENYFAKNTVQKEIELITGENAQ